VNGVRPGAGARYHGLRRKGGAAIVAAPAAKLLPALRVRLKRVRRRWPAGRCSWSL